MRFITAKKDYHNDQRKATQNSCILNLLAIQTEICYPFLCTNYYWKGDMQEDVFLTELRASLSYPSEERLDKGAVAVIECIQEIPCNPCETACRFKAIIVGEPITNLPRLIGDRCRGCGECISACPGLAIFIVDKTYTSDKATVSMPYEYYPLPEVGSIVDALDRNGRKVCDARIVRVSNPPRNNKTAVVTVAVKKEFSDLVRNVRLIF